MGSKWPPLHPFTSSLKLGPLTNWLSKTIQKIIPSVMKERSNLKVTRKENHSHMKAHVYERDIGLELDVAYHIPRHLQ